MTIWNLFDKAVAEVDADRQNRINEAYIVKLEARIKELENTPVAAERINNFVAVLNDMAGLQGQTIMKIKIVRAAFGLALKEAKDAVEKGVFVAPEVDDGYDDLPF